MSNFIENQNWRYATKKFDTTKKVSSKDLETLKEAVRLSVSSYGLQLYKVIIIEDEATKKKLVDACWGQKQIAEASHVFVFANFTNIEDKDIDSFIENTATTRDLNLEDLKGYGDFMKSKIITLPNEEKIIWTSKQTYLALGNLLNVAAELKIDATPMEGFEPPKVNKILDLDKLGINASLVVPVGYRHEDDSYQHLKKVRKSTEELFITI